jgi:hypothetical protein
MSSVTLFSLFLNRLLTLTFSDLNARFDADERNVNCTNEEATYYILLFFTVPPRSDISKDVSKEKVHLFFRYI